MACTYYSDDDYLRMARAEREQLTRMLCEVCTRLDAEALAAIPELPEWWRKHQEDDRRRAEHERAAVESEAQHKATKRAALAKLTHAERRALGIRDE